MGPIDPRQLMMMRGVPQPIAAPTIPQPQMMNAQPMPYRETGVTSILNGLNKFIASYRQESQAQKQKASQEVDRDLTLLSMGIPVDQKAILKNMKRAGINLALDDTRPVQGPQQPGPEVNVASGYMGMQPQPQALPGPPIPSAAPPQAGLWDRMKAAVGLGGNQNFNAPVAEKWLQDYASMGQQRLEHEKKKMTVEGISLDNDADKQKLIRGMLNGDPRAIDMAAHLGLWQRTPLEQIQQAGKQVGMSEEESTGAWLANALGTRELQKHIIDLGVKLSDRFGGDTTKSTQYAKDIFTKGTSDLRPGRTFQEALDVAKFANDLMRDRINMPANVANLYAEALVSGNTPLVNQMAKAFNAVDPKTGMPLMPTKNQFEAMTKLRELGQGDTRIAQGWQGLSLDQDRINQQWKIHAENFRLNAAQAVSAASGRQFDDLYRIYSDPNADTKQKNFAVQGMAKLMSKMEDLEIPVGKDANGKDITVTFSPGKMKAEDIVKWYDFGQPWITREQRLAWDKEESKFVGDAPKSKTQMDLLTNFMAEWGKTNEGMRFMSWPLREGMNQINQIGMPTAKDNASIDLMMNPMLWYTQAAAAANPYVYGGKKRSK